MRMKVKRTPVQSSNNSGAPGRRVQELQDSGMKTEAPLRLLSQVQSIPSIEQALSRLAYESRLCYPLNCFVFQYTYFNWICA